MMKLVRGLTKTDLIITWCPIGLYKLLNDLLHESRDDQVSLIWRDQGQSYRDITHRRKIIGFESWRSRDYITATSTRKVLYYDDCRQHQSHGLNHSREGGLFPAGAIGMAGYNNLQIPDHKVQWWSQDQGGVCHFKQSSCLPIRRDIYWVKQ